uniref:Uncharacterized protein n=1 Tax=Anopheles quadriannulatus TaxID=34691 RepID=A0A182XRR3_ANOQN
MNNNVRLTSVPSEGMEIR